VLEAFKAVYMKVWLLLVGDRRPEARGIGIERMFCIGFG
jgi:hypothetical protein